MRKGVIVLGTDTGVGKTYVSLGLLRALKKAGHPLRPCKPLESGGHEDSDAMAREAGLPLDKVLLRSFEKSLAPLAAARVEKFRVDSAKVLDFIFQDEKPVLVEGAGGLMVPYTEGKLLADLAGEAGLPVLLVARAGLGTINHSLLTLEALRSRGLRVLGIILNGAKGEDASEAGNRALIEENTDVPVLAEIPWNGDAAAILEASPRFFLLRDTVSASGSPSLDRSVAPSASIAPSPRLPLSPSQASLADLDRRHVWHPFTAMKEYEAEEPVIVERAEGSYLFDTQGRRWLDGVSSLWVAIHGHRHPALDEALKGQVAKVGHSTLLGMGNEPSVRLASELVKRAPKGLTRVFYSDSGSEAMEIALKIGYQYWKNKGEERPLFIAPDQAYHGDTVGAVSLGGIERFHEIYRPLLFNVLRAPSPYCYRCPLKKTYPDCALACADPVEEMLVQNKGKVGGIVVEAAMQAAAGMIRLPPGYLARLRELCDRHGVLLIVDEVAAGFGRTGSLFASEQEGIVPDIMALAKGLSGGYLPLAATLAKEKIYEAFLGDPMEGKTFYHGHTFTGNQLGCATALASLEIFDREDTLTRVRAKAARLAVLLRDKIAVLPWAGDIRQKGLMAGIELVSSRSNGKPFEPSRRLGWKVCRRAREKGVWIRPLGDVLVLMPPLNISDPDLELLVEALAHGIQVECARMSRDG